MPLTLFLVCTHKNHGAVVRTGVVVALAVWLAFVAEFVFSPTGSLVLKPSRQGPTSVYDLAASLHYSRPSLAITLDGTTSPATLALGLALLVCAAALLATHGALAWSAVRRWIWSDVRGQREVFTSANTAPASPRGSSANSESEPLSESRPGSASGLRSRSLAVRAPSCADSAESTHRLLSPSPTTDPSGHVGGGAKTTRREFADSESFADAEVGASGSAAVGGAPSRDACVTRSGAPVNREELNDTDTPGAGVYTNHRLAHYRTLVRRLLTPPRRFDHGDWFVKTRLAGVSLEPAWLKRSPVLTALWQVSGCRCAVAPHSRCYCYC